jgi:HNH endonuclease
MLTRGPHSGRLLRRQDVPSNLATILEECRASLDPAMCWPMAKPYQRFGDVGAHRWVAAWRYGSVPAGRVVRHSCDNPRCINPDHLVLGSQADNLMDARVRGRTISTERRAELSRAAHQAGLMRTDHLEDRLAHPRNRPVICPDGTTYASAALAADAHGLTRQAIAHRCRIGWKGWRWA